MKAQRRHELKENELAIQIENFQDYVRNHGTKIVIVITAVVVGYGGWNYVARSRAETRSNAWQLINNGPDPATTTPEARIASYKELADKNIDETISANALLAAGETALGAVREAREKADKAGATKWSAEAKAVFERINSGYAGVAGVGPAARFALAALAEDAGSFGEAESIYKSIASDAAMAGSPYESQAKFRLEKLKGIKTPVKFAASAPVIVSTPASSPTVNLNPTAPVAPIVPATQPASTQPTGS